MTPIELRPYQTKLLDDITVAINAGHRSVIAIMPTGAGKCLGIGTPVLKYDGTIVPVEQVLVGDLLMGPDSKPRTVLGTTRGTGELYRITPIKGDSWVCNDVHVLSLTHTESGAITNVPVDEYLGWSNWAKHCWKQYSPEGGVDFESSEKLPLDPYFLGVWLGDGSKTMTNGRLRGVAITKPDLEIQNVCEATATAYGLGVRTRTSGETRCPTHSLTHGNIGGSPNELLNTLRSLMGATPHIPEAYRTASRTDRAQLLAGLTDTDGYVHNGTVEIAQKSNDIAAGIAFVARSLGFRVLKTVKFVKGNPYNLLSISGDWSQIPTRIARKQSPPRRQKKHVNRTGFKVEPIGVGEYAGFELDGDHLFLLGDFTVTHNTRSCSELVRRHLDKGGRVLWCAHREELVGQAFDTMEGFGLNVGCISAKGVRPPNKHRPVQVASTQTLATRGIYPEGITMLVLDEVHHYASDQWVKVVNHYREQHIIVIGLTATPAREDGRSLGDLFDTMVLGPTVAQLQAEGVLVPCTIVDPGHRLRPGTLAQSPVEAYKANTPTGKAIVFAPNVKAATFFTEEFATAGIKAAMVTGAMKDGDRNKVFSDYSNRKIDVLVNVGVATEGYDDPPTDTIILARGIGSLVLYTQIIGRGLRTWPGKPKCTVLDLFGCVHTFGPPDEEREYSLEGEGMCRKGAVRKEQFCKVCGNLMTNGAICEVCANEKNGPQLPQILNIQLHKYTAKLRETPDQRKAYYFRLLAQASDKGYKEGFAAQKSKAIYGVWPPRAWLQEWKSMKRDK